MSKELTLEEQATNYETIKHIRLVQKYLNVFVRELLDRGDKHDNSKLESPEVEAYAEVTKELKGLTYDSPEYKENLKKLGPALTHHYANNSHHPEYGLRNEVWKEVTNYPKYEVSSHGNIRNSRGEIIKSYVTPKGYLRTQLSNDGNQRNFMVHRLVAQAFLDNPKNKPEVNHKDSDRKNNHIDNLEWVTSSENLLHGYEEGLKKPNTKYVVHCEELNITTFGTSQMETELRKLGFDKISAAGIWGSIDREGKHLDLTFTAINFEEWMASPLRYMNLIDLIEMFCDWKAATQRHANGDMGRSLNINQKRFSISDDIIKIFENTVRLLED
jgi:hypothetical protein